MTGLISDRIAHRPPAVVVVLRFSFAILRQMDAINGLAHPPLPKTPASRQFQSATRRIVSHPAQCPAGAWLFNVPLHTSIAHYAKETDWVLEVRYMRVGLPPIGWQREGILGLITNSKDARALHHLPKVPLVDFRHHVGKISSRGV
ncbi:MAG: hypothetical protein WCS94_21660 [Verrucomicrobiota bacterium]